MKKFLLIILIIILLILYGILSEDVKNKCEKSNGNWVVLTGAGYNNKIYKCLKN